MKGRSPPSPSRRGGRGRKGRSPSSLGCAARRSRGARRRHPHDAADDPHQTGAVWPVPASPSRRGGRGRKGRSPSSRGGRGGRRRDRHPHPVTTRRTIPINRRGGLSPLRLRGVADAGGKGRVAFLTRRARTEGGAVATLIPVTTRRTIRIKPARWPVPASSSRRGGRGRKGRSPSSRGARER